MTADTLKTTRVLELYQDFLSGKLINKQQAAEQYHVNVRSIQRDIDSIRDFLSEQCAKEGIVRKIEYDKKENGYRLITQEVEQLSKGEVLALCKILLESRAFTKEQVEKQLQIILNLCVSQKEKATLSGLSAMNCSTITTRLMQPLTRTICGWWHRPSEISRCWKLSIRS